MNVIFMILILLIFTGIISLLYNAVIEPDWLDWVQFACFTMLWPLELHLNCMAKVILFWTFIVLALVADAVSLYRVRKHGGKTEKHIARLCISLLVALIFLIITVFSEAFIDF